MRNIKLTEAEWKYICDALIHTGDFVDSWEEEGVKYPTKAWHRRSAILKSAERKIYVAKKEAA